MHNASNQKNIRQLMKLCMLYLLSSPLFRRNKQYLLWLDHIILSWGNRCLSQQSFPSITSYFTITEEGLSRGWDFIIVLCLYTCNFQMMLRRPLLELSNYCWWVISSPIACIFLFLMDILLNVAESLLMLQSKGHLDEGQYVTLVQSGAQPIWRAESIHHIQVREVHG